MQELEKLQFVLEFKIEELRGELEPKDERIANLEASLKVRVSQKRQCWRDRQRLTRSRHTAARLPGLPHCTKLVAFV